MTHFMRQWNQLKQHHESAQHKLQLQQAADAMLRKPIVLYGAGRVGIEFARMLRACAIEPLCFCDRNKTGTQTDTDIAIAPPHEPVDRLADANILICSPMHEFEIRAQLCAMGVAPDRILPTVYIYQLCAMQGRESDLQYMAHFDAVRAALHGQNDLAAGYEDTFGMLCDDASRQAMFDWLRFCLALKLDIGPPAQQKYFDADIVTLSADEVFVDCGMYTGDTAQLFFDVAGGRYAHYYGFEPDADGFAAAKRYLADRARVTISQKGLWSHDADMYFDSSLPQSSHISERGKIRIQAIALDSYFGQMPHVPTFIKMDIEGAEAPALRGAKNILAAHKPRLAISAYHKPDDLAVLPRIIRDGCADYRLYLRFYAETLDVILYAV